MKLKTYRPLITLVLFLNLCIITVGCKFRSKPSESGFNMENFHDYWVVEAENDSFELKFLNDTLEIIAPKGLTLWRKEKMKGNIHISYSARIMDENLPTDRLSDLNCFWMASDPKNEDIFARKDFRSGKFANYYSLQLYYMGFGGNYNSTTRFRRYSGDENGINDVSLRPAVITEYTDSCHLLKPNHWYRIELSCVNGRVRYIIDNECLVDYTDPSPLSSGWFGFRTTWSRAQITNFSYATE